MPRDGREICPSVEGLQVGGQEDREGPATLARQRGDGLHVYLVDVGPLLPVNLDRDELLVEDSGGRFVFEAFFILYMTPMTSGVPNAQKDGPILTFCLRERFFSPRIPLHRVPGVLQEVRTLFVDEAVGFPRPLHF